MTQAPDAINPADPYFDDPIAEELWMHVIAARRCWEEAPAPESHLFLVAHLDAFNAHFLKNKTVH